MKYVVLVPDGAADYPLKELGDKTPLQVARKPNMDFLARCGITGTVKTVPDDMDPGSDVANLSLFGYDPRRHYTGRGPLEAASRGIRLGQNEVAFRCNLVTVDGDSLKDYGAGHISSEEAKELIKYVGKKLGRSGLAFYPGVSYRHLMVIEGDFSAVQCVPPHDIVGGPVRGNLPRGEGAAIFRELMLASRDILEEHPINLERGDLGRNPANMIWLWGQGKAPTMPSFAEKYGLKGCVISAVDLIKGIGVYAGLKVIDVPGATGYFDTDYGAKADYALKALEEGDFAFVHVEAPDEAGHAGDIEAKIEAIERFDERLVGRVMEGLDVYGGYKILVAPDHPTPITVRTHVIDAVPFAIYSTSGQADDVKTFDEVSAKAGSIHLAEGYKLMDVFLCDQS